MMYAIYEHETHCGLGYLISSILDTLGIPATSHFWIDLGVLLIWPLRPILHVWFYLVGAFTVSVEPLRIVYGGVSATPELQWGVSPIYFLSYDIFDRIHVHGHGLPVGNIWASMDGKWRAFLSNQWEAFLASLDSPSDAMNPISTCSHGSS